MCFENDLEKYYLVTRICENVSIAPLFSSPRPGWGETGPRPVETQWGRKRGEIARRGNYSIPAVGHMGK